MRSLLLPALVAGALAPSPSGLVLAAPVRGLPAPAEVKATAWVVRASAPRKVSVGERAQLDVVVEARGAFHLNEDYPINFRPAATPETAFERTRIERPDGIIVERCTEVPAQTCRARVPAAFVAEAEGTLRVGGTLAFSACDDAQCLIEKVAVAATVEVAPRKR